MNLRALLGALAVPRLAGSPAHTRARELLRDELTARGFAVLEHRFAAIPRFPLHGVAPADGVNLIAVRGGTRVATWLAAHYDSKGQPLSMAGRLLLVGACVLGLLAAVVATLVGWPPLTGWLPALVLIGVFLALSRASNRSPGAVDNAAGVLTVFATLEALPADAAVGALLLDGEELGLTGARALVRERAHLLEGTTVINFDGIDDRGTAIAFVHRPGRTIARIARALGSRAWRRLPVVVDGSALAGASAECVTIMKGDWATMRVIHTRRDDADRLELAGARQVATAVAAVLSAAS
jgi:Peptidase family M28